MGVLNYMNCFTYKSGIFHNRNWKSVLTMKHEKCLARLARIIFEAYFDRWFRKRVSADALSWYQSSKLGSSIIDFHSEKVLWHENNDFSKFSI